MLGEQKMQENGLGMWGVGAEMVLGQLGLEAGMLSRKEQAALKGKLEHVNSRQKKLHKADEL